MTRSAEPKRFFLLAAFFLLAGMASGNFKAQGGLKPEIRLRLYRQAIEHYEKAEAHLAAGRQEEALKEIHKATGVVRAFPEAYALARTVYLRMGQPEKAREQEEFFRHYDGPAGASLYGLRDQMAREVEVLKRAVGPPDFQAAPALLLSGVGAAVLILGMFLERAWMRVRALGSAQDRLLILEPFAGEEEGEPVSWLFKLCVFLLPAPLIFALLVSWGLRHFSEIVPVLLFAWTVTDLGIHLIFFADLSGLGGFRPRRPPGS